MSNVLAPKRSTGPQGTLNGFTILESVRAFNGVWLAGFCGESVEAEWHVRFDSQWTSGPKGGGSGKQVEDISGGDTGLLR
jgi:hypothetical protein